jgi:hypothetical protein
MRAAYQENDEARMSNDEQNPNAQMTKVLREMLCLSNVACRAVAAQGRVIPSSLGIRH